jgi:hypothetical protein
MFSILDLVVDTHVHGLPAWMSNIKDPDHISKSESRVLAS